MAPFLPMELAFVPPADEVAEDMDPPAAAALVVVALEAVPAHVPLGANLSGLPPATVSRVPRFASHTRTLPSAPPLTNTSPPRLQEREWIPPAP